MANNAVYRLFRWASRTQGEEISKGYLTLFLPEDPIVVDAGAHYGEDTRVMCRFWPKGTIHAFEPVPSVFGHLCANVASHSNARCYPVALAAQTGEAVLHLSHGSDASSSLMTPKDLLPLNPHLTFPETIRVEAWTLDDWGKRENCPQVDFLWLDMQGAELAMLKASPRLLATVRAVYLEVALVELYQGNPLYAEVRQWMEEQGFRLEAAEIDPHSSGNAFFVRQGVRLAWGKLFRMALARILRGRATHE